MSNVVKIILAILAALTAFLAGWFTSEYKNRKKVAEAVKNTIEEMNKAHAVALESLKDQYEEQLKKKDRITSQLRDIIQRLLIELNPFSDNEAVSELISKINASTEQLGQL